MNLIETTKNQIDSIIKNAYEIAHKDNALPFIENLSGAVEIPRDSSHGDFAATHAMSAAKSFKMSPKNIAEILINNMKLDGTFFDSANIAGPGFINFTLSNKWYGETMLAVETMGSAYGTINIGNNKRVMVEFVSANPTGPMTIGNARGGVLGDTLASVLSWAGFDIWREFLINDTGNQVDLFGKSLNARYLQICFGKDYCEFPDNGYHGEDITNLAQMVYDAEGENLANMQEDERTKKLVDFALPYNINLMKSHLERYRIKFDEWFHESTLHENGYIAETLELLDKAGLLFERDGALWLKNTELGCEKDEVLKKSNGFYTYYTFDIAYHRNKLDRGFDKAIDIWGADHHGHSKRLLATLSSSKLSDAFGVDGSKYVFVIMQMVRLLHDGETIKVSKRTGKALTLSDLLDEVSVDACRFFFNAGATSHLDFDLGLAIRQDSENPVYYVQYAHARICSLIKTLETEGYSLPSYSDISESAASLLNGETEHELIKFIALLPEEIRLAARDYDPSRINKYVVELAARFHKFYSSCRIKGEDKEVLLARLKLADTTRTVIKNCLEILGITAPEKM